MNQPPKTVLDVNLEETASALFYNGEKLDTPYVSLAGTTSSPVLIGSAGATAASDAFTPVIAPMAGLRNASGGITHLHFERMPRGGPSVDPMPLLARACFGA